MPKPILSLLCFLALAGPGPALGGEIRVSLSEAVDRALSGNRALQATRERALAAHSSADMTDRLLWPRISLSSQLSRTDNPAMVFMGKLNSGVIEARDFIPASLNDPSSRSQLSTRLAVEAPVDLFSRFGRLKDAGRTLARSADAAGREKALDLRLRVIEAYSRAAVSAEVVSVVEAAVGASRAREEEVEAKVAEGAALRADLLRVRARRREREAELAGRLADVAGAKALLNELLGSDGETTFVPSAIPTPVGGPVEDEGTLVARALANRPGLEALRLRAEAATGAAEADHKARLPEIGVFAQLTDDRGGSEGQQSYAVGGFLRVSLLDPTKNARQAEAQLAAHAFELDRLAALDEVRRSVRTARERVRSGVAAVNAAQGGAEEGQEALRVVQERRREGLATLTDELETEAASLAARLRELSAQAELAVAEASLERAIGGSK